MEGKPIQWFPGHMARARRKIEESLFKVDIVAEIVDARVPVSSRNPIIRKIIGQKPRVILLNKCDLADPRETDRWIAYYKKHGLSALAVDCRSGRNVKAFLPMVRDVLKEKIAAWEKKGMVGRPIRIMVLGIPNVGKSAFINKMCAGGRAGKADVQDRPGVTRENRWFTIGKGFELLDTPGVLWHKFEDQTVGEHLAFTGAINDNVLDVVELASHFLCLITALYPQSLSDRYKLTEEDMQERDGYKILEQIGKKRGMLVSGGEIHMERAASTVLDEFRGGKLGRITLEQAVF